MSTVAEDPNGAFRSLSRASEEHVVVQLDWSDKPVNGLLRFDVDDGLSVSLSTTYDSTNSSEIHGQVEYPAIHGRFVGGQQFTLYDSFRSNLRGGASDAVQLELRVNELLVGAAPSSRTESAYSEMRVRLDALEPWLALRPILTDYSLSCADGRGFDVSLRCKEVHAFGFSALPTGPSVTCKHELEFTAAPRDHGQIRSGFDLQIGFARPSTLDQCRSEIFRVQSFLSLLVGQAASVDRVRLVASAPDDAGEVASTEYLAHFARPRRSTPLREQQVCLPYSEIDAYLPSMWANWCQCSNAYATTLELLLAPELFGMNQPDFRLVATMQALEALHRRRRPGSYVPDEEYGKVLEVLVKAIPIDVPSDLKDALRARLRYGNEYSLRRRLSLLAKGLGNATSNAIHPHLATLIDRAVDMRNQITHSAFAHEDDRPNRMDVYWASQILRWFLRAALLADIGVPDSTIATALGRSPDLSWAQSQLRLP